MSRIKVGSVCSGIEAASVAFESSSFEFSWFSEIATYPSRLLAARYPAIGNLGDMCSIPERIVNGEVASPDLICGGTPCQAFSLAGWKKGLGDDRGNLTLKFVDIVDANDRVRLEKGCAPTIVLWENVEGVLRDKTNAFGCFISSLAGLEHELPVRRWPAAGVLRGPTRNIAWRVLDAKFFGLPQQRRRLYVMAGGKDFSPESVLFEKGTPVEAIFKDAPTLTFVKDGVRFETFREYTDCLYSAYGTKWNGNAAAYNGSLFVLQDDRLRRFTPIECERLMGFPDAYTELPKCKPTSRYQALGNSWAVPVVRWIGERIVATLRGQGTSNALVGWDDYGGMDGQYFEMGKGQSRSRFGRTVWAADRPLSEKSSSLESVVEIVVDERCFITPAGCKGILRRSEERSLQINPRLERALKMISSTWSDDKIEQISRRQKRGRFSDAATNHAQLSSIFPAET